MNGKSSDAERIVRVVTRTSSLNACAIAHVSGAVDEHITRIALNWMQKRHPLLKTRLDINGGSTRIQPEAEAPLPIALRVIARQGNDDWQAEAEHELTTPLPWARGSIITVTLLKSQENSDIIFTLHHVMNDAATVLYLLRDLLGLMLQLMKGNHIPRLQVFAERSALDHLPSGNVHLMNSLLKTTALMVAHVGNVVRQGPVKKTARRAQRRALSKPASLPHGIARCESGSGRVLHYWMSPQESLLLYQHSRQENTTSHAAIAAAALQAVCNYVSAYTPVIGAGLLVQCLSSMRVQALLTSGLSVGTAASVEIARLSRIITSAGYSGSQEHFWDTARHVKMAILPVGYVDHTQISLPLPTPMARYLMESGSSVLIITNVGRILTVPTISTPYDTLARSGGLGMADSFGIVINTARNRPVISYLYPETVLADDRANQLGAEITANLRAGMGAD